MIKYCNNCDQNLIMGFNFCPVCGKALEIISDFDVKNKISPYLRDTDFYVDGRRCNFYLKFHCDSDEKYRRDSIKIIKRFIESKPKFLNFSTGNMGVDTEGVYGSLELRLNEKNMFFQGSLIFNINKTNLSLVARLLNMKEMSSLFTGIKDYKEYLDKEHNKFKKGLRQLNKLEKGLEKEEE